MFLKKMARAKMRKATSNAPGGIDVEEQKPARVWHSHGLVAKEIKG